MLPTFAPLFDENTIFTEKSASSAQLENRWKLGIIVPCRRDSTHFNRQPPSHSRGTGPAPASLCQREIIDLCFECGIRAEFVRLIFQRRVSWPPTFPVIAPVRFAESMVGATVIRSMSGAKPVGLLKWILLAPAFKRIGITVLVGKLKLLPSRSSWILEPSLTFTKNDRGPLVR